MEKTVSTLLPLGDKGGTVPTPLTSGEETMYCPVGPRYRHKWGRARVIPSEHKGRYLEMLRCRRCLAYVLVDIRMEGEKLPIRKITFIKTMEYESKFPWEIERMRVE